MSNAKYHMPYVSQFHIKYETNFTEVVKYFFLLQANGLVSPNTSGVFIVFFLISDTLTEEPGRGQRPLKRNHENKYVSRSLRLNNNIITDLSGLHAAITHFLAEPLQLAWLDLSFNDIGHIDPVGSPFY